MTALDALAEWPCADAAAVVLRGDDVVATWGDIDQRFALASVTKLLTAVTVLIGVEEGSVNLDTPVAEGGATMADLLAHSSGLGADGTRLDLPGKRRVYSNAGYELAASHLATAAEMAFADYMAEGLFEPAGMLHTSLDASPAFGATSTASDLARFVTSLRRLLAPETIERMITPHLPELVGVLPGYGRQVPNPWGLGPELRGTKSPHWTADRNSASTWGHFGQAGTFLWVYPEEELATIVLTNKPFGEWALPRWPALSEALLDEF